LAELGDSNNVYLMSLPGPARAAAATFSAATF
jgi:hypothetical protein